MTITVEMGEQKNIWSKGLTFRADVEDIRNMTWDYTGEIGTDTVLSATAVTENITAGSPSILSNTVVIAVSAGSEGTTGTIDLTMTTTAGSKISRTVRVKVSDL